MPDFIYQPPLEPFLPIIYQDDDIVVFDKPAGLLSVPGRLPENFDSLWLRGQRVWPELKVIHRLDMATSGLIMMGMHKGAQSHLGRQFQQRQTEKQYLAEIWGQPEEDKGKINLPLRCDWPNRPKQIVDFEQGKAAETHWEITEKRADSCLVKLKPITGRTHQLRVHMQALGNAIVGDRFYAPEEAQAYSPRLHLHATSLSFYHPSTEQWLNFTSEAEFS